MITLVFASLSWNVTVFLIPVIPDINIYVIAGREMAPMQARHNSYGPANKFNNKKALVVVLSVLLVFLTIIFIKTANFNSRDKAVLDAGVNHGLLDKEETVPQNGFIQGKLGFPTEPFPEYMKVFAYNLDTDKKYWVESHGEKTYRLEVPPGRYHVYAYLDNMPGYWAYYNEFVVNGMQSGCEQGNPIVVEVFPGQVTDGVDPIDWEHYIDDRFYERFA
jgi:hypothetical protein